MGYWSGFSLSPVAVAELFAKVNLVQLPNGEFNGHIEQNSSIYGARSVLIGYCHTNALCTGFVQVIENLEGREI